LVISDSGTLAERNQDEQFFSRTTIVSRLLVAAAASRSTICMTSPRDSRYVIEKRNPDSGNATDSSPPF
jgi:hypothetical protein